MIDGLSTMWNFVTTRRTMIESIVKRMVWEDHTRDDA